MRMVREEVRGLPTRLPGTGVLPRGLPRTRTRRDSSYRKRAVRAQPRRWGQGRPTRAATYSRGAQTCGSRSGTWC